MKRPSIWMLLGILLLSVAGCTGSARSAERLTERALNWLSGDQSALATPLAHAPALEPTPTLAPLATATAVQPASQAATPRITTSPTVEAETAATPVPGPFEGVFAGTVQTDNGSSAPLYLELSQRGDQVSGTATIGEGLEVSAGGFCGTVPVPPITLRAEETVPNQGRRLETTTTISASGFDVDVVLEATVSPDGKTLQAEATLYTPALCSRNPVLEGTLTRQ